MIKIKKILLILLCGLSFRFSSVATSLIKFIIWLDAFLISSKWFLEYLHQKIYYFYVIGLRNLIFANKITLGGQTGYSKVRLFRKFPLSSTIIMTIHIVQQDIYFIFFGTQAVWEHSLAYNVKHSCVNSLHFSRFCIQYSCIHLIHVEWWKPIQNLLFLQYWLSCIIDSSNTFDLYRR